MKNTKLKRYKILSKMEVREIDALKPCHHHKKEKKEKINLNQ